nr:S-layer family protein [Pleurocapsa sp. MO_226.B13]
GLNFRDNPGDIFVRGDNTTQNFTRLTVENFNLVGGDITFDTARISVLPGGRFELGGLSAAGVVGINENGSLSFPDGIDRADISLTNSDIFVNSDDGGLIDINARNLDLTQGSSFSAEIDRLAAPGAVGGDIIINATDTVSLDGSQISNILASVEGQTGDINITANSVSLRNNSVLRSETLGQGDAGNIIINASESISLSGLTGDELASGIFARVFEGAKGRGGNVNITTPNLSLADGFQIVTDLQGEGNGGNITVDATNIVFDGIASEIRSEVLSRGIGDAGNIKITTDSFSLTNEATLRTNTDGQGNAGRIEINANSVSVSNGSELASETEGQGDAGNIIINATDSISFSGIGSDGNGSGIFVRVFPRGKGKGGNVELATETLSLNGGNILADAQGEGDGGNITIDANNVVLDGSEIRSSVSSTGMGDAGTINITTDSLSLTNVAVLRTNTDGQGNANRIEINANSVSLNNGSQLSSDTNGQGNAGNIVINATESISFGNEDFAGIFARVQKEGTGTGGNVELTTTNLSLANSSQIVADTQGEGNAGDITVDATNIVLDGINSEIRSAVQSTGIGDAGDIKITTDSLSLNNSAALNTSTQEGRGDAGTVEINATSVTVDGDSEIRSETTGQGNGGNVIINASDRVSLSEDGSAIFGRSFKGAEGDAGNVEITTNSLSVTNRASVNVTSSAEGNGGDVIIEADSIELNRGRIEAQTEVGEGGNIRLEIDDDLILRNNSLISATAFADADGGNININQGLSDTEFLLFAFPPTGDSGNDIRANADRGDGGRIDITAAGVFGIEFREISALEAESNSLNDFTVTSEFGQSGETIINRTVEDPTSGLIELPQAVSDASDQISQNPCEQGIGSEFIITGKGGLPPNPNQTLKSNRVRVDLIEPFPKGKLENEETGRLGEANRLDASNISPENPTQEAVPAMGWVFNDKGEVTLTAYDPTHSGVRRSGQTPNNSCSALEAR